LHESSVEKKEGMLAKKERVLMKINVTAQIKTDEKSGKSRDLAD